jgi:hypothetical protein
MVDDDRDAAENYRQQRQSAIAAKTGFKPKTVLEQLQRIEDNRDLVFAIARGSGAEEGREEDVINEYKQALLNTSEGSPLDDIHARQILERIIGEIEEACLGHRIPIRSGVVYGVAPELGLRISQSTVLETQASIIDVSIPFITFCNLVTKTLARSLPQYPAGPQVKVSNDPSEVRDRLQRTPDLVTEWVRIFSSYAELGWPPLGIHFITDTATQAVRYMLIRAVELFAIAHEYGHHVMMHGVGADSSEETTDPFVEEHQADIFARSASIAIGSHETEPNFYAMSGTGGVIILGALELVRRAKSVLETGNDQAPPRERHPPLADRIAHIALLDQHLEPQQREAAADMRRCFLEIIEVIWEAVRPHLVELHSRGIRPIAGAPDPGGWLPN